MFKPEFSDVECQIDETQQKFPYSLVWTALPCLTCLLPCIGHLGICKSDGTIYDFIGGGPIHTDELAFGRALKQPVINQGITDQQWDGAIDQASKEFSQTDHNLCCNNCHHHVARALNIMNYNGKSDWSQTDMAIMTTFKANHLGVKGFCIYLLPILIVIGLIVWKLV